MADEDAPVTIPPLSDEQRQLARTAATEARRRRAEMKEALRRGETTLADVLALAEQDEVVAHAKVIDVLKSLPRVGTVRAGKVMERLDIAANRRLRGLGKHQTAALIAEFRPDRRTRQTRP
jgi:S13-like H2TH domain